MAQKKKKVFEGVRYCLPVNKKVSNSVKLVWQNNNQTGQRRTSENRIYSRNSGFIEDEKNEKSMNIAY